MLLPAFWVWQTSIGTGKPMVRLPVPWVLDAQFHDRLPNRMPAPPA
jgi:hypothetical protein